MESFANILLPDIINAVKNNNILKHLIDNILKSHTVKKT
jgi:hypothetical protein